MHIVLRVDMKVLKRTQLLPWKVSSESRKAMLLTNTIRRLSNRSKSTINIEVSKVVGHAERLGSTKCIVAEFEERSILFV
jgi:hypothetical protein